LIATGIASGEITGVLLLSEFGARACIAGSTLLGGHRTPSDFTRLSPNGSGLCPVDVPLGAIVPSGVVCVAAQLAFVRSAAGGAVCAGGVAGVGLRLREGSAGTGDDKSCDDKRLFDLHPEQTVDANGGSGLALATVRI
jgi:hypothetical protein